MEWLNESGFCNCKLGTSLTLLPLQSVPSTVLRQNGGGLAKQDEMHADVDVSCNSLHQSLEPLQEALDVSHFFDVLSSLHLFAAHKQCCRLNCDIPQLSCLCCCLDIRWCS